MQKNKLLLFTCILWIVIIISLFLFTSSKIKIPFFEFPKSKGILLMVEANYKQHNLVGLREEVYALPHGVTFVDPRRMKNRGVLVAHSREEAIRMIDSGTDNISPKLQLSEKDFHGFNIYKLNERYYIVRAMYKEYGNPLPSKYTYRERYAGTSLEDARSFVLKLKTEDM